MGSGIGLRMPAGPLGLICQMCREHRFKFVSVAQGLVPAEVGSGAWIGPMLPGHIEGVAPFCPHLLLLLLLGGYSGACPWLGERWGSCTKVSSDGLMISSVPISPSVSDSSNSSSTGLGVAW